MSSVDAIEMEVINSVLSGKFKDNEEALAAFNELPKDLVEIMIKHRNSIDDFSAIVGNQYSMISVIRYFDDKGASQ